MIVPNISTEDLKKLPLRPIVALAARCARRVESLGLLPDGHPARDRCRTDIDRAIRLAEDFARGSPSRDVPAVIRDVKASRAIAQSDYVARRRSARLCGRPTRPRRRWKASACATSRRQTN